MGHLTRSMGGGITGLHTEGAAAPQARIKIPLVLVESPYAGRHGSECICEDCQIDVKRNLRYLRAALHDCFTRGEAPFASHGLYAQPGVLDDTIPGERQLGIAAGLAWGRHAKLSAIYTDLGWSSGMKYGRANAEAVGRPVELRSVPGWAIADVMR